MFLVRENINTNKWEVLHSTWEQIPEQERKDMLEELGLDGDVLYYNYFRVKNFEGEYDCDCSDRFMNLIKEAYGY